MPVFWAASLESARNFSLHLLQKSSSGTFQAMTSSPSLMYSVAGYRLNTSSFEYFVGWPGPVGSTGEIVKAISALLCRASHWRKRKTASLGSEPKVLLDRWATNRLSLRRISPSTISPVAVSRHHFGCGPHLPITCSPGTSYGHDKL